MHRDRHRGHPRVGADVGNAELTVGAPGVGSHLTRIVIDCLGRVRITGLAAATGTGTGTVARAFAVDPTAAACTATAAVGTPAAANGTGLGERMLSLAVTAGTTVEATVTCARVGYADATSTVSLTAHVRGLHRRPGRRDDRPHGHHRRRRGLRVRAAPPRQQPHLLRALARSRWFH